LCVNFLHHHFTKFPQGADPRGNSGSATSEYSHSREVEQNIQVHFQIEVNSLTPRSTGMLTKSLIDSPPYSYHTAESPPPHHRWTFPTMRQMERKELRSRWEMRVKLEERLE
jgi:hypothetical protein